MSGYAKLFSSITESSLWSESKEARLLFVSMLAKADSSGFVEASVPGLSRIANLSMRETRKALKVLSAPDPHSKDPEMEGRRIADVPGGWAILNYEKYRARRSEEERREYMRQYMVNYRKQRKQNVSQDKPGLAQAEAEAEAEKEAAPAGAPKRNPTAELYDAFPLQVWQDAEKIGIRTSHILKHLKIGTPEHVLACLLAASRKGHRAPALFDALCRRAVKTGIDREPSDADAAASKETLRLHRAKQAEDARRELAKDRNVGTLGEALGGKKP